MSFSCFISCLRKKGEDEKGKERLGSSGSSAKGNLELDKKENSRNTAATSHYRKMSYNSTHHEIGNKNLNHNTNNGSHVGNAGNEGEEDISFSERHSLTKGNDPIALLSSKLTGKGDISSLALIGSFEEILEPDFSQVLPSVIPA